MRFSPPILVGPAPKPLFSPQKFHFSLQNNFYFTIICPLKKNFSSNVVFLGRGLVWFGFCPTKMSVFSPKMPEQLFSPQNGYFPPLFCPFSWKTSPCLPQNCSFSLRNHCLIPKYSCFTPKMPFLVEKYPFLPLKQLGFFGTGFFFSSILQFFPKNFFFSWGKKNKSMFPLRNNSIFPKYAYFP